MRRLRRPLSLALAGFTLTAIALIALLFVGADAPVMRFVAAQLPPLSPEPYLASAASPTITDRNGQMLYAFLNSEEQWSFPIQGDAVSPLLRQAVLAVEDKRFYAHAGVDVRAVLRAAWSNLRADRVVSGASTLTMQLVKLRTPLADGISGKAKQALLALRLEEIADKTSILDAYLNAAPYGGNLVGAEAAARRYFGKSARELLLHEAALLAGLPKAPTTLNPFRHPDRALQRRNHVLRRLFEEGLIDNAALEASLHRPLDASWHDYPALAPHLAMACRETVQKKGGLQLTLDGPLQARLEDLVRRHLRQFDNAVGNAAVIVAEVPTASILARIGSADFHRVDIQGQVDLCRAPRAPGSALKPFIYALAMERNRLYASETLMDDSLDYGVYNPSNFDGAFNGLVSAGEALRWSLNIPAVQTLDRIGVKPALDFLKALGIDTLHRSPDAYGLGLVLGNCEVSLDSLAGAYMSLARLGSYVPLKCSDETPEPEPLRVLSEGAAAALWRMLEQPFPDEPWTNQIRIGNRSSRVCWKTGTSTGLHDAWAIIFNAHYVTAVWLGNNDGRSSAHLVGAQAALPLAARIFRSLPLPATPDRPALEQHLRSIEVCTVSGLPIGQWCPTKTTALLPREQFLHRRCDAHRPNAQGKIQTYWPADARSWDLAALPREGRISTTPSADTTPLRNAHQRRLDIRVPAENATYVITGASSSDRLCLKANHEDALLHWYQDSRHLGSSDRGRPLYLELVPGEHQVTCMDENGATAAVVFTVERP